ncbi:hypothetical protein AB0F15_07130 [Amycolatopsis sp. NPDC026612]|uniref:hypothetical protein n=1 Tax=Amycolatopsis sp. NPDC026612 TaxID=3155466 RepID=UPI0034102A09
MTASHADREIRPDDDLGHPVSSRPELVHQPAALAAAATTGRTVVVHGEGHSIFGQAGAPLPRVTTDEKLSHRARSLGAVQYLVGSVPMRPADWTVHFGPTWPLAAPAKHHYDPDDVLGSGPGVFVRSEGK